MQGRSVTLTAKVFDVLYVLVDHIGKVLTKKNIFHVVWKETYNFKSTNVPDQISSIRHKLGLNSKDTAYIQTVIGVGYRLPVIRCAPYHLLLYIGTSPADTKHNQIIPQKFWAQIAMQFAPFFYSTFFVISRHTFLSGHGERCRIFLPHCRGPPLLKSGPGPISEEQEVCPMRQVYIRETQLYFPAGFSTSQQICAKRSFFPANLLHIAEFLVRFEKLFLIRSAISGLTVTLPNMDRKSGGECG